MPNILIGNIQVCRCAAHTAQLVPLNVTKYVEIMKYWMDRRSLTKYLRKISNGYREIFEFKELKIPQLDCPTRWGSTYTMLQSLLEAKAVLSNIASIKNKSEEETLTLTMCFGFY